MFALPEGLEVVRKEDVPASARTVVVPSSVKRLDDGAFKGHGNLKRIIFQRGSQLEKIGRNCFQGSGLEEFVAPDSLRVVGSGTFYNCK